MEKSRNERRLNRHKRSCIKGTATIPRVVIYRSNKHFEVQVIDDEHGNTLAYYNSKKYNADNNNMSVAEKTGREIAAICLKKNIKKVVFDRNGYPFEGKIKCIAQAMREAGMEF